MVHVTAFFAGILAFIFIGLSFHVIRLRQELRIAIGDGGNAALARRVRTHGNFAEYVPFALLLMAIDEINGTSEWLLVLMGLALVAGRLSHAYSLLVTEAKNYEDVRFRAAGILTTFGVIALLALIAIF